MSSLFSNIQGVHVIDNNGIVSVDIFMQKILEYRCSINTVVVSVDIGMHCPVI